MGADEIVVQVDEGGSLGGRFDQRIVIDLERWRDRVPKSISLRLIEASHSRKSIGDMARDSAMSVGIDAAISELREFVMDGA